MIQTFELKCLIVCKKRSESGVSLILQLMLLLWWCDSYTSYSELYPLLAVGNLPLVKVGEISQTINAQALTVENTVSFEGPLTSTSFSASASFEIRSPKRVQVFHTFHFF